MQLFYAQLTKEWIALCEIKQKYWNNQAFLKDLIDKSLDSVYNSVKVRGKRALTATNFVFYSPFSWWTVHRRNPEGGAESQKGETEVKNKEN